MCTSAQTVLRSKIFNRLNLFYLWNTVILLLYRLHKIKILSCSPPPFSNINNFWKSWLRQFRVSCWGAAKETANVLWQAAKRCSDIDGWPCLTYSVCAVKQNFLELDRRKENKKRREKWELRLLILQARRKAAGRMDWWCRCGFITCGDKRQGDHNSGWIRLEMR